MTARREVIIGVIVLALMGSAAALSVARTRDRGPEVRLEEVVRRDLVGTVTASGNIRARRTVDISSDVSARVSRLLVAEGEDVQAGQVLLRLDPTQFEAARARAEAALLQARAQAEQARATLTQARRAYDRTHALWQRDSVLVSQQQLEDAETQVAVAEASLRAAEFGVQQASASLAEAEDRLSKTVIRAPIAGKVTRLNVEEGETVIVGTMNNPGSLVLTISDLDVVEAVVQVDETDVPLLSLGDSASLEIDAYPDREFVGTVTEIGNSAIRPPSSNPTSGTQAAIDFEVVITLQDPPALLRPDLSTTAEIVTDTRDDALAVPIIAVTVRPAADTLPPDRQDALEAQEEAPRGPRAVPGEVEGVFLYSGGRVSFRPVRVGIAGQEYFEVLGGLSAGDTVVAGPYQAIRQLRTGDPVRRQDF